MTGSGRTRRSICDSGMDAFSGLRSLVGYHLNVHCRVTVNHEADEYALLP